MARRGNEPIPGMDKARVRVVFAEVEGNNESVQEALKTMVSAMNRPIRAVSEQKANGKGAALLTQVAEEAVEEVIDQAEEPEGLAEETAPPNPRKPRGTGRKVDRNAGLKLVPDLNFRPEGKQALKEFVDEKSPSSDIEVTLALVYYMQHEMGLTNIGPAHVMTAFNETGKQIPVDVKQTIRNVRNTKMWLNYTDIEDVKTTTQGDNFIKHEIGKSE